LVDDARGSTREDTMAGDDYGPVGSGLGDALRDGGAAVSGGSETWWAAVWTGALVLGVLLLVFVVYALAFTAGSLVHERRLRARAVRELERRDAELREW
jgi:hypothetical protein